MSGADQRLAELLAERHLDTCPDCGQMIDRFAVAWNAKGSTEAGTEFSIVEIICPNCDREIARVFSWFAYPESFEDVVATILGEEEW